MELMVAIIVWLFFWLLPLGGFFFAGYSLVSKPLRRSERIRSFLMLVDAGLQQGRRVEDTIVSVAETRDPGLGMKFQTLAAAMRTGKLSLSEALESVPGFMPTQIIAMLYAGEKLGDLQKVLPACRHLLKDNLAYTRSAMRYMLVAAFATTPVAIIILGVLQIYVLPEFHAVAEGMGIDYPAGLAFMADHQGALLLFELCLILSVWLTASLYFGAPPLFGWFESAFPAASDHLLNLLPWRRKRLQRDFASMLAILLDAGVPEPEAVTLAANCTASIVFVRRAERAAAALGQGMKLTDALQMMDDSGEFRWRLTNALHAHGGFLKAITGWNESLDARAFQQEQATAQLVTTSLVLLNGLFVGFIVVSVFSVLIAIINNGVLW